MRILFSLLTIFSLPFIIPKEKPTSPKVAPNAKYCNPRYDFCLAYPATFYSEKATADNADGIQASSKDQDFLLTVAGSKNALQQNPWELFEIFVSKPINESADSRFIYMIIRPEYYETAFYKGDYCYYQKLLRNGQDNITLELRAPKDQYNKLKKMKNRVKLKM